MRALIVKELRQTFLLPLVVTAVLSAIWLAAFELPDTLLRLSADAVGSVIAASAGMGALLGYVQFANERWFGTLGYLQHRGGGARAIFGAKASVGIPAAWLAGVVPPLVFAIVSACGPNAAVIHWERLVDYAILSLSAIAPYCAAAWTAQLRRGWRDIVLLLSAAVSMPLVLLIAPMLLERVTVPFLVGWSALSVSLGAVLYVLALRAFRAGRDSEFALDTGQHVAAIALAGTFCLLVVSNTGAAFQDWARAKLLRSYPRIVQDGATGEVFAAVPGGTDEMYRADRAGRADRARGVAGRVARATSQRVTTTVTSDGTLTTSAAPAVTNGGTLRMLFSPYDTLRLSRRSDPFASRATTADPRSRRWGWDVLGIDHFYGAAPQASGQFGRYRYFDRDAGVVRVITLASEYPPARTAGDPVALALDPPFEVAAPRGDGKPFSADTRYRGGSANETCFIDFADRTLWGVKIERGVPVVRALALPNGDELLPLEEWSAKQRTLASSFPGRAGNYIWVAGGFVTVEAGQRESSATDETAGFSTSLVGWKEVEVTVTDGDPLALAVSVVGETTRAEELAVVFEPHSVEQRALAFALQLATLLDPPGAVVAAHCLPERSSASAESPWPRDMLFAGGKRPALALVVAAWGVLLTVLVVRRQRRHGYAPVVVVLSALLTAIFGVWAFAWLALLDPRRCSARTSAEATDPQAELVIQSA